ncbi:MAG: trypsin-like serine protease [Corynebacterium sp.]|uniref:trypsin-like serine protease n=1 Tax=Corynebacterium sp. TaxID=1720 RepID=UPI0026DEEB81|nr:trypsin-like serine protease [Corynebacterium sp.]MDO5669690.1 trypsin-like serine protease [Corynebacterium sp.]
MSHAITVRLNSGRSYCSGVLIAPDLAAAESSTEYILSCAHFLRERTGEIKVGGAFFHARIRGAVRIPRTDIAVLRMDRPSPPKHLLGLAAHPAPFFAPTRTEGFGGSWHRKRQRLGRVVLRTPFALGRNLSTFVTSAAILHNSPKAIKGDSGGPVIIGDEVVAVQSMITDPFGVNTGLATVAQVAAHRRSILAAVAALEQAY